VSKGHSVSEVGNLIARSVERGNVAEAGKELLALAPAGETHLVLQIGKIMALPTS